MKLIALGLAASLSLGAPAAQPGRERREASQLFDAGNLAYRRGQYDDAARAFEAAYALYPRAEIAFSWAQALRRQYFVDQQPWRLKRAAGLYRVYLDEQPTGGRREDAVEQLQQLQPLLLALQERSFPDGQPTPSTARPRTEVMVYAEAPNATVSLDGAPATPLPALLETTPGVHAFRIASPGFEASSFRAVAVEERLVPVEAVLVALPATLDLQTRPAAELRVDGKAYGRTPLSGPVTLDAGAHELVLTARGRVRATRVVTLSRGQHASFTVDLPRTRRRDAALGLLGSAGGLGVLGGVTLGLSLHAQNVAQSIAEDRGVQNISPAMLADQRRAIDRRDAMRTATAVVWSGAVITGLVGLTLFLVDRR